MEEQIMQLEDNKYYISADSTYADDRVQVLNHCDTFGIFDRWGDILPIGKGTQGIYYRDTRFISRLELRLNNQRPLLLSSNIKEENEILSVDLTNSEMELDNGKVLHHGSIHIRRSQFVKDNLYHEKIELENYNGESYPLDLSLKLAGDFRDIFEIRGLERSRRGEILETQCVDHKTLILAYRGLDGLVRKAKVSFPLPFEQYTEDGTIHYWVLLSSKQKATLDYSILFEQGENGDEDDGKKDTLGYYEARESLGPDLDNTKSYFPVIETANEHFTHWVNRSQADLVSLMADTPYGKYPYAGVPWYNTAFGRDGILTAFETLWVAPDLTKDVLKFLAAHQSNTLNEAADAEPGKILHETRGGEMVALNEVPFKQYYGTIDATPLFVLLAGEYFERTADFDTIKSIWPNLKAAMNWIAAYGDPDGDGFVEYQHKAANGLTNQGWKDSFDSVSNANGELADPPIALCEVQGYVYAAKTHAANIAQLMGEKELAEKWKAEARELKLKFNEVFWDAELNCFVLALDGQKRPCRVKSSNAGHLLFTGIADSGKAKNLVKTLMRPDMFSGWGIRTLSSNERRYNPMSYHNGTVWPHDVALIAFGMAKYGFREETVALVTGLFDASLFIPLQRLPELFCGFERRKGEAPTSYPVACSPQAWSVAAVFILLQALLQIRINPSKKEISFHKPILPGYLEAIRIKNLQVCDLLADLEISRHGNDNMVGVNWENHPEDWKLVVVK
ncbi:amylo-alpha-1,6-glucosidase [Pontibacter sp. 13R65]|uniref:amylo-alpha-1,6-glucosidase n=1 Tax=Pontibacter sp. 13R65 TaxID=3127458 RepID=UPI00301CC386